MQRLWGLVKGSPVLSVAVVAALVSMVFVPPSAAYASYIDAHTLLCLFSMLAVLCAFRGIGVFATLAMLLVRRFKTVRSVTIALVMVTFVGSMFLTNDMALLTFLPLTAVLLSSCNRSDCIPFAFIMQTLAANLGGMILPFGNPQNLYLFSYFHLSLGEFVAVLAPAFACSLVLILLCCLRAKPEPLQLATVSEGGVSWRKAALYLALFALVIASVFNLLSNVVVAVMVAVVVAIADREALRHVDYALLATFVCFFIFSGNLASVPAVQSMLGSLMHDGAFAVATLASQIISNVPAAILLAPFTSDWQGLLLGVDIGGVGTPVASLASLITLAEYGRCKLGATGRFVLEFEGYNFAFLAVLCVLTVLVSA